MSANLHSYDADIIAWANEQARLLREGLFASFSQFSTYPQLGT